MEFSSEGGKIMAATKAALVKTNDVNSRGELEQLPTLFSRLGDDVMQLVNSQLALLKVELTEEANTFARRAIMIAVGAAIGGIGFALLNVAIALGVSTLFAQTSLSQPASYALGFVVTGGFYLLVGGILIAVMKGRLAKQQLVPERTVAELRKDKAWLKNEL